MRVSFHNKTASFNLSDTLCVNEYIYIGLCVYLLFISLRKVFRCKPFLHDTSSVQHHRCYKAFRVKKSTSEKNSFTPLLSYLQPIHNNMVPLDNIPIIHGPTGFMTGTNRKNFLVWTGVRKMIGGENVVYFTSVF